MSLPIWAYWEGPQPLWITKCLETHALHSSNFRLIGKDQFQDMWEDRADLQSKFESLCVEMRSDIIRAYVISRFGGLWLDADCVVFRNLAPIVNLLDSYDFIASPQYDGDISGAFVASRPGGIIASAWYERQKELLRNNGGIAWLSFSSYSIKDAILKTNHPYFRLRDEVVQPIHWDQPAWFFWKADEEEHKNRLNESAYVYMLSSNMARNVGDANKMLEERTFFSYLLRQSFENKHAADIPISGSPCIGII